MNILLCDGSYQTDVNGNIRCNGDLTAITKNDLAYDMLSAGQMTETTFNALLSSTIDIFVTTAIVVFVLRLLQNR